MARKRQPKVVRWITGRGLVAMVRLPRLLPYEARIAVVARLMDWIVAPLAGYRGRIAANLRHAVPELGEADIARLRRSVPRNIGRMLMEISSPREFTRRAGSLPILGPGVQDLEAAMASGRPIIIVTGHFGNYDAARAALTARGLKVGALYRPIDDPYLDRVFRDTLAGIAEPNFPRGRSGLGRMIRFLRQGNAVAILPDQHVNAGAPLTFFGRTALTSLAAAEMAVKYDALLLPVYGIRRGDSFEIAVERPIPHGDPAEMMQKVNDSLEARVRADMDQWLWIHRRWKPERQRARAAASIRR